MRNAIVATVVVAIFCGPALAQSTIRNEATLTVRGQGVAKVAPDHAILTAEVVTRGKSLDVAVAAHRTRAQRAANALRDGLAIESSTFRLNEIRNPPRPNAGQGRNEAEYQATTSFELKSKNLEKIDSTITEIAKTGLFQVRNLRFGIDEKNPGMKVARQNAVEDARDRAKTYAEAAGVQLGNILRIDETEMHRPLPLAVSAPMARGMEVVPPETMTLSASVTIAWKITSKP